MPIAATGEVYDALIAAGADFGIADAGYRTIESLRLEKGYRAWGADITPADSPFEAGLGWAVKLKTDRPFLGREAAERTANSPKAKLLACFTVDDPGVVLQGRETIYRNGEAVGYLSSGGWGYSVEKNIGYGYVRNGTDGTDGGGVDRDFLASGRYELEVACDLVPCELQMGALYDPKMTRIKV